VISQESSVQVPNRPRHLAKTGMSMGIPSENEVLFIEVMLKRSIPAQDSKYPNAGRMPKAAATTQIRGDRQEANIAAS